MPTYGKKPTNLTITTDTAAIPPTVVKIDLLGPDHPVPMIEGSSQRFQLTAQSPGETVSQEFEIQTVEKLGEEPWVTGLVASLSKAEIKLLAVEMTSENRLLKIMRRTYRYEIRFPGPKDEHQVIHCSVKERTRTAPVSAVDLPTFRCTLTPALQAAN